MRNIIIMAFALIFGAVAANAHGHSGRACNMAKRFLKYNGPGIEALLNKEATGHLKTLQDVAKVKVELLHKAVALDPPIPFLCKKTLKKVKKLVKWVAVSQAMMMTPEASTTPDAAPADAQTTPKADEDAKEGPTKVDSSEPAKKAGPA